MMVRLALSAALLALAIGATPPAPCELDISFSHLRSTKGNLLVCITADPAYFPDCSKDPDKRFMTVPADRPILTVTGLAKTRYAVSVHHDENGNARLDTFAGIPKEGVGFSRNPTIGFGPPKFANVAVALGTGANAQTVRMRYFL